MDEFRGKRVVAPSLPGTIVKQILEENDVTVKAAAEAIGISRQLLHLILSGRVAITADTAVKLGTYFGNGPDLWLNLQNKYSIQEAQKRLNKKIARIRPLETKCA